MPVELMICTHTLTLHKHRVMGKVEANQITLQTQLALGTCQRELNNEVEEEQERCQLVSLSLPLEKTQFISDSFACPYQYGSGS